MLKRPIPGPFISLEAIEIAARYYMDYRTYCGAIPLSGGGYSWELDFHDTPRCWHCGSHREGHLALCCQNAT